MAWDEPQVRDKDGNVIGTAPGGKFQDQRTGLQSLFLGGREPASLTVPLTSKTGLDTINQEPVKSGTIDLKMKKNPFLEKSHAIQRGQQ
jgi:hypothetical protein